MAHVDHDAIVNAFQRVDPSVAICDRGGADGYTHVHGPSQAYRPDRCTSHWIVIEKVNGTVSLRDAAGIAIQGHLRPVVPIKADPLGYSVREDFGGFTLALTAKDIRTRWPTFDDFALDAIQHVRAATTW